MIGAGRNGVVVASKHAVADPAALAAGDHLLGATPGKESHDVDQRPVESPELASRSDSGGRK